VKDYRGARGEVKRRLRRSMNKKARSFAEKVLKRSTLVVDPFHVVQDTAPRLEQQISDWETKKNRFGQAGETFNHI